MSLLPEGASFEERVQECFLAFKGAGVMISALDAELVSEWAAQAVPFEVVARGIRRAAEQALWDARQGEPALRSLRACRKQVNVEIRKYLDRAVGGGEGGGPERESLEMSRHKKMRAALRKLGRENPAMADPVKRLLEGALAEAPADLDEAARREEAILLSLARSLPFAERVALGREAASLAEGGVSARARKMSRRFHRGALVRKKVGLPSFW